MTVEAEGQLLKTDRADVASTLGGQEIADLPSVGRNFTRVMLLTPGATELPWQHASSENPQGSTHIMVNGQHFSGTGYQLDGTDNRDPMLGIIVINPNLEAIAEAKVTSQNYGAEFGQATAGVASVQTRSGTNETTFASDLSSGPAAVHDHDLPGRCDEGLCIARRDALGPLHVHLVDEGV